MPSLEVNSVSGLELFGQGCVPCLAFEPGASSAFLYASGPDGRQDVSWPLVLCLQVVRQSD